MILGLCGSFAVVPAMSLASGGSGKARGLADPTRPAEGNLADVSYSSGSAGLGALIVSAASASSVATALGAAASAPARPPARRSGAVPQASDNGGAVTRPVPARLPATGAVPVPVWPVGTALDSPVFLTPTTTVPAVVVPPPVAVPHVALASGGQQGVASWLNTIPAGTCANNAAPMGAVITVTNGAGVSVKCKVVSRGPFVTGRVVDLAEPTFSILGSASQGLVSVTVTW